MSEKAAGGQGAGHSDSPPAESLLYNGIRVLGGIGGLLYLLVALIVVSEIIMRFFFRAPLFWSGELSILLTIVASFLVFAYTLQEKGHTRVDFITQHLSPKAAFLLSLCTSFLSIAFCAILLWYGVKMIQGSRMMGEVTQTVQIPLWIPQSCVPIGGALMLVPLLRLLRHDMTSGWRQHVSAAGGITFSSIAPSALFMGGTLLSLLLLKSFPVAGLGLLFFFLLFNGMPVAYAMGLFGVLGLYVMFGGSRPLMNIPLTAYSSVDSAVVVAFPLFILSGAVLRAGQIGPRIFNFAYAVVRHLPGGIGIASIIFCGLFAAMTGSSIAVAASVSVIALPEMLKRGYSRKVTIGLLAAGGTLGILFPPSLALIFYSALTFESIGSLFMAAVIPGILLSLMFMAYIAWVGAKDENIQREPRASIQEILEATRRSLGGLIVIIIILGGIYSGLFTVTEAGAVALLYSIFLCVIWYRTLSWRDLIKCLITAAKLTGMITLILIAANITSLLITMSHLTQDLLWVIKSWALPSWFYIAVIMIFLIILGGPLEAVSIMVITCPILYPIIRGLGFDGIWFGVALVINTELALISPPEGVNLFILQEVSKGSSAEVSKGVLPFCIIMCVFLLLVLVFPQLTLWLPSLSK